MVEMSIRSIVRGVLCGKGISFLAHKEDIKKSRRAKAERKNVGVSSPYLYIVRKGFFGVWGASWMDDVKSGNGRWGIELSWKFVKVVCAM